MIQNEPIVAIDLGGTHFRAALVNANGTILDRVLEDSRSHEGPEAVVERIAGAAHNLLNQAGYQRPVGIGVAVAGPIDGAGVIHNPPNLTGWGTVPFGQMLRDRLGSNLWLGNDANIAVLGEHTFGAAQGITDAIYMTLSTGVGGGVLSGGVLVTGCEGLAAELGHIIVTQGGRLGACGHSGCLESLVSGPSIAERAREAIATGHQSKLTQLVRRSNDIQAHDVFQAAAAGDELSTELIDRVAVELASGIVSLVHIFNPKMFILGGGVTGNWNQLDGPVRRTVQNQTFPDFFARLDLTISRFGDDVGLVGAAALVLREIAMRERNPSV